MTEVFLAMDSYRFAMVQSREKELEVEAMCLSGLAFIDEKVHMYPWSSWASISTSHAACLLKDLHWWGCAGLETASTSQRTLQAVYRHGPFSHAKGLQRTRMV